MYATIVHNGFIIPWSDSKEETVWGTGEAEIAQLGSIPAERIVGFRKYKKYEFEGPVFIRRSFRKQEPEAFKYVYKLMCGMTPGDAEYLKFRLTQC